MREPAVVRKYPNRTDPIFVAPTEAGGILPLLRLSSQGHLDLDVVQTLDPLLEPDRPRVLAASFAVAFLVIAAIERNGNRCNDANSGCEIRQR